MSLILPNRQSVFVTLRDISRNGACVVRQGNLALQDDDIVGFEARDYDSGRLVNVRARVRWLRHTGFNTYVGLAFINATLSAETLDRLTS